MFELDYCACYLKLIQVQGFNKKISFFITWEEDRYIESIKKGLSQNLSKVHGAGLSAIGDTGPRCLIDVQVRLLYMLIEENTSVRVQ